MKGSIKMEGGQARGKSKDEDAALTSSVRGLQRVAEANQLRLQHLELGVVNLTNICNALRKDIRSLGLSNQGSVRKAKAEAIDARSANPSSASLELKGDMLSLRIQMQHLAAALAILKDPKTTGNMEANGEAHTGAVLRNVQAATKNQKRSTRSLIRTTASTTEKKMSMKLAAAVNNGVRATQPESQGPRTTGSAKASLKSTVSKTKTTISKVYVELEAKRTTKGSVSAESSVKNLVAVKGKGSVTLTVKANQGENNSQCVADSGVPAKHHLKTRRKWSSTKQIMPKK